MNKKGWIRIVEASVSILIIFSVLLVVSRNSTTSQNTDLTSSITPMLDEIARNVTLREQIIQQGNASIPALEQFISKRIIQSNIKFDVNVCSPDAICSMSSYPAGATNIYSSERILSSTLNVYSPKKVKIFLWRTS